MTVSRGKQYVTPVIVEVKPSNAGRSNIAPSSPPASPNSKKARFANTLVDGVTRPLTSTEAWSLYYFETHARQCRDCYDPVGVYLKGAQLCANGHALALDVAEHVYHRAGEVYSNKKTEDHKQVRVELPLGYDQTRGLLKSMDRALRSTSRTVPVISYDPTYPVSARRRPSPERERRRYEDERKEVVVEPARSERSQRRSSHKPKRYGTVVVQDDVEAEPSRQSEKKPDQRRGSLYETDIQRRQKDRGYNVEEREPASRERDRDERRRKEKRRQSGGYWT
ncbi:hypothetical protein LTR37_009623 [Vermiconidia calcicola]|uniref:Uncharacterized protein n=1 Tax=Vermiconidia calcicola TaxID=1690605 RepID=A0ACC3N751_9PEZI|nr:hypothetical protein LTR37_009623 [Vermiconidia calcicola]